SAHLRDLPSFPTRRSSDLARSGCGIAAIFASTALSPSASSARGPGFCCLRVVSLFVFFISGLPRFLKTIQDESSDDIDIAFKNRDRKSTRLNSSHVAISYA